MSEQAHQYMSHGNMCSTLLFFGGRGDTTDIEFCTPVRIGGGGGGGILVEPKGM